MSSFRTLLLAAIVSSSATAFAAKPAPLPPLPPPLGRIGDVVQKGATGGIPAGELAVTARFKGCAEDRTLFLTRYVAMGAALAGEHLQTWLSQQPALQKKLFGKKPRLAQALDKARSGSFFEGRACAKDQKAPGGFAFPDLTKDGRLTLLLAPDLLCKNERGPAGEGGVWLFAQNAQGNVTKKQFTAAVSVAPAKEGAKDPCLPLVSAVLFDAEGKARLRYHADYNGAVEAEVLGDSCQTLRFRFDQGAGAFVPTLEKTEGCRK